MLTLYTVLSLLLCFYNPWLLAVFVQLNLIVLSGSIASVVAQHLRFSMWHASIAILASKLSKPKSVQKLGSLC
jgi:hypothetical protein